jgi:scyllo-inositol 2-dehydrogenase (NADP+)
MGLLHTEKNGVIIREFVQSEQGNYGEYYDGIYQAIRNNKPLPVTPADGLEVIKIIEAAYKSNDTKCVVDL